MYISNNENRIKKRTIQTRSVTEKATYIYKTFFQSVLLRYHFLDFMVKKRQNPIGSDKDTFLCIELG